MVGMLQGKGGGVAGGGGGLSQGKGGAPSMATQPTPANAGEKPVPQPPRGVEMGRAGGPARNAGGDLASMFLSNRPAQGVRLPDVTQPTRPVLGSIAPGTTSRSPPPVQQQPQAPTSQQIQQRLSQMTPEGMSYGGAMGGGVNPLITGSVGAPAIFAEQYQRALAQNPAYAKQMLDRAPPQFRAIFAPVTPAAPAAPPQMSQAARMAAEINRRAAARR